MSSFLNETTGACISGPCRSIETLSQHLVLLKVALAVGLIGILIGWRLGYFKKDTQKSHKV